MKKWTKYFCVILYLLILFVILPILNKSIEIDQKERSQWNIEIKSEHKLRDRGDMFKDGMYKGDKIYISPKGKGREMNFDNMDWITWASMKTYINMNDDHKKEVIQNQIKKSKKTREECLKLNKKCDVDEDKLNRTKIKSFTAEEQKEIYETYLKQNKTQTKQHKPWRETYETYLKEKE